MEWENIGFVFGNGATDVVSDYKFTDHLNLTINLYYRLKQIDFDGKFDYSNIEEITISPPNNSTIKIYPNVVQDWFTIENGEGQAIIYSSSGQLVKSFKINISNLPQGQYFLQIQSEGQTTTKRFVKQ